MFLGIDPGARKLGYALIDDSMDIVDAGILLMNKKSPTREDYFDRMCQIDNFFEKLIKEYKIKSVGIEKLFFTHSNQSNAEFVYGVRGNLIVKFQSIKLPIFEYTPKELKKNITGNGNANKILVQTFIKKIFSLENLPEYDDAADALGLAYLALRQS